MSLLLERDKQFETASDFLNTLCGLLEEQYEEAEDQDTLHKFCIVKSDLARVSLALGDYEAAVENSSTALDLSQGLSGLEKMRLSSHLTQGLGHYFLDEMDEAITVFQMVLTESNEDVDVMLLVAQALWAVGLPRQREIALQQIRDWFEFLGYYTDYSLVKDPKHIGALFSLASVGLLQRDMGLVASVKTALRELSSSSRVSTVIHTVLEEICRIEEGDLNDVSRAAIMLDPSSGKEWRNLSKGGDAIARLALKLASRDPKITTEEMSLTFEKSESLGYVQSGLLLSPWRLRGWRKLNILGK